MTPSLSHTKKDRRYSPQSIPLKSPFLQACRVAKLFAKHFKVDEQEKELQARCVNIAVGTPNRIAKLAELGALNFGRLKLIVIDCALDAKERCNHSLIPNFPCKYHTLSS